MTELVAPGARSEEGEPAAAFGAVRAELVIVVGLLVVAGLAWFLTAERMAGNGRRARVPTWARSAGSRSCGR